MKKKKLAVLVAAALGSGSFHPDQAYAAMERVRNAPITFERNMGQFAPDVLFVTKGVHGEIAVRSGDVSIAPTGQMAMRIKLRGANPTPEIEEHQRVATRSNYYGGPYRSGAITGVPHFGRLVMKDVYPNVDLALHGSRDELEYDFLVAPGADPSAIRIDLSHADEAWLDESGNLRMRIAGGELTQRAPVAYQTRGEESVAIPTRFELRHTDSGLEAGFVVADYDTTRELVIDPVFAFSTFIGSSGGDFGGFMKIDNGGWMHSAKVNRAIDANIVVATKHDPLTSIPAWSTGLHGGYGVRVAGMAIVGDVTYVAGSTPPDFPAFFDCTPCTGPIGASGEAFVIALDSAGVITAGRYIGGSGADEATGIATDAAGNVYVTGNTRSADFAANVGTYQGNQDIFVAKFSPDLATMESALVGSVGYDSSSAIAVAPGGDIYVAMQAGPNDNPDELGAHVVLLSPSGVFQYSAVIGGSSKFSALEIDSASRVVIAGTAGVPGQPKQAFVSRYSPLGGDTYSHSFGGSNSESVRGLTVSGDSIYLVGGTDSGDFPSVAAPAVGASGGGGDAFVARFGPGGLEFATRFGGTSDDFAASVAVAPSGDVYLMGTTTSADFPTVNPTRFNMVGDSDLFVARLSNEFNLSAPTVALTADGAERILLITRNGSLAASATVKWSAVNGTALAGTHYGTPGSGVLPSGVVTFAPGVGSISVRIGPAVSGPNTIPIIGAASFATPRTFSVALTLPTGGPLVGSVSTSAVTISQGVSSLVLEANAVSVLENTNTAVTVRVKRADGSLGNPASVNYATANGTALAGTHYTARTGTLTWGQDDYSIKDIYVPIIDDAVANASRNFRVNLSGATGLPLSGPAFATVTILDQDNTIAFAAATQAVTEGAANVTLQVRRTGSANLPASVNWSTENASAVAGTDFGAPGDPTALGGNLSWLAGDLTPRNIVIPLLDDVTPEPGKTFKVNLSGVDSATLGIATTTVTLSDNERGFAFQLADYNVTEGLQSSVVLTVQRVGNAAGATSLSWTTANGTATSGQDFGVAGNPAQRTGTLSWISGETAAKTITIPIINDLIGGEPPETFTVVLSTTTAGYTIGSPGVATVAINDNDPAPESAVQFAVPKYLVLENAGTVTLDVLRTNVGPGFGHEARVNYATQPGTALATSDYVTRTGTLIWPIGDFAAKQITVNIVNNTVAEPPESFKVLLSAPGAGTVLGATSQAGVVILDDDEAFPLDGAIPAGFSTPIGATSGWHVSNDPGAYEGAFALKSDEIGDGETAAIQMEGTFAAGNASFRVKISSEPGFDFLRFYIDDVLQTSWSGTAVTGWTLSPTYPLSAGNHVLRWVYAKDGSVSVGLDRAYIDALVTPAFTPLP